jgi:hypothetical protein
VRTLLAITGALDGHFAAITTLLSGETREWLRGFLPWETSTALGDLQTEPLLSQEKFGSLIDFHFCEAEPRSIEGIGVGQVPEARLIGPKPCMPRA